MRGVFHGSKSYCHPALDAGSRATNSARTFWLDSCLRGNDNLCKPCNKAIQGEERFQVKNRFTIMANNNAPKSAFTLLELAVVITIIALIGTMGLSASRDMIDTANQVATQNRMDAIEKALLSFWRKNGRLPCPADATLAKTNANYGKEAAGFATTNKMTCATGTPAANFVSTTNINKAAEGAVPIVTLGLPKDFIYDGWGRKIAYAVTPQFAAPNARIRIHNKSSACASDTAIKILDAARAVRSTSAAYALISYGKNGHGAYPATGSTRYSTGSANADELFNCHCTSAAANDTYDGNYVQRNQNLNAVTAANYFDDIVRYKERWQLAVPEDAMNDDGYRGPDLAVGYQKAGSGTVYVYKNRCGAFVKQDDLNPLPTDKPLGIAFTAGNQHLLTYSGLGCNLYKINANGTLTNLPDAFPTPCVYNATAVMELSNNGYLAISTSDSSAVINLWKQAGDKFLPLASLTHSDPSVKQLSFSPDAKMLAVRSATNTSKIYKRKGDSFSSAIADISQPSNLSSLNTPQSLVFSPDGKYLTDIEWWAAKGVPYLNIWRVFVDKKPSTFTQLQSFAPYIGGPISTSAFSADSNYIVMNVSYTFSVMCKIDPNDVFCGGPFLFGGSFWTTWSYISLGDNFGGSGSAYYSFSRNSNYMIETRIGASNAPELAIKIGVNGFRTFFGPFQNNGLPGTTPTRPVDQVLSGSTGGPVAFSR
jgi:type II secretory pathway pseudopilin PulG